jgi:DNA-binding MarR family transcriptional regulator
MKTDGSDISELAFRAFIRAYGLFRNKMDPYFARFGISGAQWGILRALHRAEGESLDGLRLKDLGHRLLVKPPSVTSIVDRLERLGFVSRRAAADDQRAKLVTLTPAGRDLATHVLERHPAQIRAILGGLTEGEQRELHDLMEKLASYLESSDNGNSSGPDDPLPPVEEARS